MSDANRLRLLVINLILIGLCIVGLLLALVFYPKIMASAPGPTSTITLTQRPTFTPSLTLTPGPSATASRTPAPSLTSTVTLTFTPSPTVSSTLPPPGLPTLTPARAAIQPDYYYLGTWTPEDADRLARLVHGYPDTLPSAGRGPGNSAYYLAFRYPIFAWREALLRFPKASQVESWRWGLAYDLAQYGDPESGRLYAELIASGLNADESEIENLYDWFIRKEPRLGLFMTALKEPPDGYFTSYVIELRSDGGSAFIWLLHAPGGYESYPLYTHFDFAHQLKANWVVADLNRDLEDGEEIAIYFTNPVDSYWVDPPQVFNLSAVPRILLPFYPDQDIYNLGIEYTNHWILRPNSSGQNELVFQATVFPACPVQVERAYAWNGRAFQMSGEAFTMQPAGSDPEHCQAIVKHASTTWGAAATIALLEPYLTAANTSGITPFAAEDPNTQDEWKYRLAIEYALVGDRSRAQKLFNQVSTEPQLPTSSWIVPAQEFLGAYQSELDVYRACVISTQCDAAEAIGYLVSQTPQEQDALIFLRERGLNPSASGYYDFDGDGESERWFTTRYRPRQASELWILARTASGWSAVQVDTVEGVPPEMENLDEAYIADEGLNLQPATFLEGRIAFTLRREPGTQQPYLLRVPLRKEYPSKFFIPLQTLEQALLLGNDPNDIHDQLRYLEDYPGLLCQPTWSCDAYYYLLGLAAELSDDERAAVTAYHRLWADYSRSPFTVMARLKLLGSGPVVTAAPTSTPTVPTTSAVTSAPTATATITPTTQGPTSTTGPTPTSSLTPTPTLSPTPSVSPTPTVTGTPPTVTPTLTPTLTWTPTTEATTYPGAATPTEGGYP